MEARLSAVQQRLLWLLAASVVVCILVRPHFSNGPYRAALRELTLFSQRYDRAAVETALHGQAQAKAALSGAALAAELTRERAAKLKLSSAEQLTIPALAEVQLNSLRDWAEQSGQGGTLQVAVPVLDGLAESLAWRLLRAQRSGTFQVDEVKLMAGQLTERDLALEQEVGALRHASLEARAKVDEAQRKVSAAERMVQRRRRRSARVREEANEHLFEMQTRLAQAERAHAEVQRKYDETAQLAQRARTLPRSPRIADGLAIARLTLSQGKERVVLELPVALTRRTVAVTPILDASFPALHDAGAWEELAGLSPELARQRVEQRLSWHFQRLSLFGLSLRGNHLIQLASCLVPVLLLVLLLRIRRAEGSYNPLTTKVPSSLPRVGFRSRFAELVVVVLLPLLSVASAAASLWLIDQPPIFPLLSAALCVSLGSVVFIKLRELRDFSASIVRSHSIPPPLNAPCAQPELVAGHTQ